jgi:hypothetical protein
VIGFRRAQAFDYTQPAWNTGNVSGLQKKVGVLLGLKSVQSGPLTQAFENNGLRELVSDDQFRIDLDSLGLGVVVDSEAARSFQEIPADMFAGKSDETLFDEFAFLKNGSVGEAALGNGINAGKFRVSNTPDGGRYRLIFSPEGGGEWRHIASYPTQDEAIGSANDLRRFFIRLNMESEGLHIVEHTLLRPTGENAPQSDATNDFYSFRLSVMFSGWSARFHDESFRRLAEETVQLNCPAHLYPEFHWLDFSTMSEFENIFSDWLTARAEKESDSEKCDSASTKLIEFLTRCGEQEQLQPNG